MVRANDDNNDTDPASPAFKRLERDFRKLLLEVGTVKKTTAENTRGIRNLGSTINVLQSASNNLPPAPAANMLWNGDLGHSVNSWNDTSYVTTDKSKECAWYFSHHKPFTPIAFTTITTNNELPLVAHGIETGTAVALKTTTTLPSGGASPPVAAATYYAYASTVNVVKLATTQALALAGTPDVTFNAGTGAGTHGIEPVLIATDARTSALNQTIKRTEGTHSTYDKRYSRWDATRGIAQFNNTRTIDTPVPSNFLEPGQTARLGVRIARRTQYVEIPDACLMYAGIVDNTPGQRDFISGATGFAAAAVIAGASTVSRDYRMYVQTDRGYSILSPVITVANAPDDGQYNGTNFVAMEWHAVAGYLNIEIWEYTPSTGVYRLLQEISSGTSSYIDNGTFVRTGVGYPTATAATRKTIFYTREAELDALEIDPLPWQTAYFPAAVPDNYAKGVTTDRQWLRMGFTVAMNLLVSTGITSVGTATVGVPASILESATYGTGGAGASEYYGLTVEILDAASGATLYTRTVSSVTSDTVLVLSASVPAGTYGMRIVAGGFHGVLIDQVHICFQSNVSFAPNPIDARVLQPVAAPSVGTGGTGGGTGGGGGIGGCVPLEEFVELHDGEYVYAAELTRGNYVAGENMRPNNLEHTTKKQLRTRLVRFANGVQKRCTDSHVFRMSFFDEVGTPLYSLRVGDRAMTNLDGIDMLSRFVEIGPLSVNAETVVHPHLSGGHWYRAGRWVAPTRWERLLVRLGLVKAKRGTAYGHNNKPAI